MRGRCGGVNVGTFVAAKEGIPLVLFLFHSPVFVRIILDTALLWHEDWTGTFTINLSLSSAAF